MEQPPMAPGWWQASDGRWYPPHLHPNNQSSPAPASVGATASSPISSPVPVPSNPDQHAALESVSEIPPAGQMPPPDSPPPGAPPPRWSPPGGYGSAPYPFPPVYMTPKTNGLAIWSLILSILLGALGALAAIPMGFVARKQIRRSNGTQTGSGLALAGIIVSFVWLGLFALIIVIAVAAGSSASSGPSLSDLTANVQAQITGSGTDGFNVSGVGSVVCNPPSSWQPGATFTCYAYDSSNSELGEYDGTVEPNDGSGNYRWNAHWIPNGG